MQLEIRVPETKPATEWINGRPVQKMSPRRRHAMVQKRFLLALSQYADEGDRGEVGAEWDVRLQPPGEPRYPLVPDVAYVSYTRVPKTVLRDLDYPEVGPDAVVEVVSPGDRRSDVLEKVRIYLATGSGFVAVVDPRKRVMDVHDRAGVRRYHDDDTFTHDALPGFTLPLRELFRDLD